MPIETRLLRGLIQVTIRGDVTPAEFTAHANEMARIERECGVSPHRFTDLSENVSLPDFGTMSNFAYLRTNAKLKNNVKSAVFAPSDFHFGMARMFQELNRNPQIDVKVFREKAHALEWVDWKGE